MLDLNLQNIDYAKYERLAQQCAGPEAALLLFNPDDKLVWASEKIDAECLKAVSASRPSSLLDKNHKRSKLTDNSQTDNKQIDNAGALAFSCNTAARSLPNCSEFPLYTLDKTLLGYLILLADQTPPVNAEPIGQCIIDEWGLLHELDLMTSELTDRYEELNLVYNSRDEINQFSQVESALEELVKRCQEHMSVDLALLTLPDKNIISAAAKHTMGASEISRLSRFTSSALYELSRTQKQTLVINSTSDPLAASAEPGPFFKLVSCPITDANGEVCGILAVANNRHANNFNNSDRNLVDVISRKASKIIQSAYDRLTGLLNRNSLESALSEILERPSDRVLDHCLVAIRLEGIGILNDMYGLEAGDSVIKSAAELVHRELRTEDIVARTAGNIFVTVLYGCAEQNSVSVADKLQQRLNEMPMSFTEDHISLKSSLGIVPIQPSATTKSLLTSAELVLDLAKKKGRNRIEVFRQTDKETITRKLEIRWANKIQEAIAQDEFELFCQGIYAIDTPEQAHHYEILLRLKDGKGKHVSPAQFMPAAEQYRLMPNIDRWVLQTTLKMLQKLGANPEMSWAINLSGQSVSDPQFKDFAIAAINDSGVSPKLLGFELTETTAIDNLDHARALIEALTALGCETYLDDFGTGVSSFSYLQSLPFDYVKIDGCFIRQIETDEVSAAMVSATCKVAAAMKIKSVAEFVEHPGMIPQLKLLGVDYLQGYCLHKPQALIDVLNQIPQHQSAALTNG